jgi:hypothetical protein
MQGVVSASPLARVKLTEPHSESAIRAGAADDWLTPGRFALMLALLVVATFPGVLLGGTTFITRDFGMFSYPVAYFHRQCFWRGELPLWNPYSNCGLPFLAQWNTLTLYPGSLIYLLAPLTWSLSFFCLAHLFWAGLGMYYLAHAWTRHPLAAGLAGVIFAFNGLTLNFLMWPSHVATFSWLPWVVWLGQRACREGGKTLVWATLAGAMQMLAGGPETILVTWLLLLILTCGDWMRERGQRGRLVMRFLGMASLVAAVCAAQLLPFLELLAHSQRGAAYGSSDWAMPVWGWANFLVPLFRTIPNAQDLFMQRGQYWTSSYYAGIGTVLLVAVAVWRGRDWRVRVLAGLLTLGLVLALGNSGLLYRWMRLCVPALGFARYPVKFAILILALAPLLAAFGFAALPGKPRPVGNFELGTALVMLLLIGMIVWMAARLPPTEGIWLATWQNATARAGFLVLVLVFTFACLKASGARRILFGCLLLLVVWLDFVTQMPAQNPSVQRSVYTPGLASAHLKLQTRPALGQSRLMLAPLALEPLKTHVIAGLEEDYLVKRLAFLADCNLLEEIPQVHGFFSLTPAEANDATVVAYVQTNRDFSALLDFMGVSRMNSADKPFEWLPRPSAMPLVTAGQQPVFADDSATFQAFFQTNLDFRQIVILPPEARGKITATRQAAARVLNATFADQVVSLQTEAPAPCLVVISQSHYPAWKAYVDGRPVPIWRANYAFQALQVPAGGHKVQLIYKDSKLRVGAVLSGAGLLTCAGLWLMARRRKGASPACSVMLPPVVLQ